MSTQTSVAAVPQIQPDAEWSRWVAENVLLNREPNSIVKAMVDAGINPQAAVAEVRSALGHPYIKAAPAIVAGSWAAPPRRRTPRGAAAEARLGAGLRAEVGRPVGEAAVGAAGARPVAAGVSGTTSSTPPTARW